MESGRKEKIRKTRCWPGSQSIEKRARKEERAKQMSLLPAHLRKKDAGPKKPGGIPPSS